jgi:hypothetical protein
VPGSILHTVNVNSGATSASVTLYDAANTSSGHEIALIAASAPLGLLFDIKLTENLTVLIAGTPDVTISVLPPPGYSS